MHPTDERFSAEQFGFQPVWLILQAIEHGSKHRSEQLHLEELGISTLTACFVNANRDPKKGEPAKPSDFWYFASQAFQDKIDPVVADTFFALVAEEKIPSWAVALAPIEKLRASRGNGSNISGARAWMRKGVLLLAPRIRGTSVVAPLALVDGVQGNSNVIDIDSGVCREVLIPNSKGEAFWLKDAEFELSTNVSLDA